jgi:hypothetical protein
MEEKVINKNLDFFSLNKKARTHNKRNMMENKNNGIMKKLENKNTCYMIILLIFAAALFIENHFVITSKKRSKYFLAHDCLISTNYLSSSKSL